MPTPEVTDNVPAVPPALLAPVDVALVPGAEVAMAAAALPAPLPPAAQEAAPARLWRSTDPNGLELAAKDPLQARADYKELVESYQTVMTTLAQQRLITNTTGAGVWNAWAVCNHHATQTAVTTNDSNVWHAWNTTGTTATSCGCTTVIDSVTWGAWNSVRQTVYRARPTIEATEEQKARWEEERRIRDAADAQHRAEFEAQRPVREAAERQRQAEFAEAEKKRLAEQAVADARAKKLLVECLSSEQRDTLEKHNYFDVRVPSGQVYRIHKGWAHNVKRVKPDGTVAPGTFCAHPSDQVPHYDNMLAQKFTLETDEQAFLKIANRG
jgi:hypothetical protein